MTALPAYIDRELWDAYCEMRRTMPKAIPFTQYAQKLIVMELMRFHSEGYDANDSLKVAIMKGWRGVFKGQLRSQTKHEVDPALQKINEDAKKTSAMPDHIRAQIAQITKRMTA
jgi:hypothetical protein